MNHSHRPRLARSVVAAVSGIALAATMSVPANAAPKDINSTPGSQAQAFGGSSLDQQDIKTLQDLKVSGPMVSKKGEVTAYVQFSGEGAFAATQSSNVARSKSTPVKNKTKVKQIRKNIESQGASAAKASKSKVVYTTTNALPGVALRGDADALRALSKRSDVVKITAVVPKSPTNKGSVIDTKALNAWSGLDQTGEGVTIAVLDTGVDYTHADFGGPGTVEAYKKAQASNDLPAAGSGLIDPDKFIGGWDLVGDDYNADPSSPTYQPVPKPDANPLDCQAAGHGTHVSGSAAGYGVDAKGKTFDGDYSKLDAKSVSSMKIGPGSAPEAQLVGIRVFGCGGSSSVVGQALDYVLDPNGDGDFSDRAQVVNMSLGSDHSPVDDPENDIVDALAELGILSVVASGNAGDVTDVGGSPGNARSSLTVANTVGSKITLDGAKVLAPEDVAGTAAGQYSANFDYTSASEEQLTGEVVVADASNKFGCDAFPDGTDFKDKWVWIQWEEDGDFPCGSTTRFNNIEAAGGAGVVLDSPRSVFDAGIGGNATIPGMQLNKDYSKKLRPAAEAGTLKLQLDKDLIGTASGESGALDTLNSSSSRGVHGSNGVVKPDVAAPGTLIGSAGVGTGNGPAVMTGTSMSTPLTAGIAALVAGSGNYSAYQVKSMVMNTATADVTAANGETFGPNRVGSGRVIADAAIKTPAYAFATDAPDLTTLSFGVVEMGKKKIKKTSSITVQNTSKWTQHYRLDYLPSTTIPGASYSLSTDKVSIQPGKSKKVKVTLTINPKKFAKTMDPTMEKQQLGLNRQYLADATGRIELRAKGQPALRVPVQAAPKAASNMSVKGNNIKTKKGKVTAPVNLKGKGLLTGNGDERVLSLVSAFELGATSKKLPKAIDEIPGARSMDLQYVGAASDAPSNGISDGLLNFGISTYGNWAHLAGGTEINVEIDTDGDGKPDFVTYNSNVDELDLDLAATQDLKTGEQVDLWPTNGLTGETDSNTFDTSAVSLPVSLAALGLTADSSGQVQYRVSTWSQYNADESGAQVPVDTTDWIAYNTVDPDLWFEGAGTGTAFADLPGQKLTAHVQDYSNAFPKKMAMAKKKDNQEQGLFLHLHNKTAKKSEVVTFTKR